MRQPTFTPWDRPATRRPAPPKPPGPIRQCVRVPEGLLDDRSPSPLEKTGEGDRRPSLVNGRNALACAILW